jgi:hypothetical protein
MISYESLPGMQGVYLEDSYVLAIDEPGEDMRFRMEFVLTPVHPDYRPPPADRQHCYRQGWLIFPNVKDCRLRRSDARAARDERGREDLGNIDCLREESPGHYSAEGDWGELDVVSDGPVVRLIGSI